jgi:phosphopentomutase
MEMKRIAVIVLDRVGAGELPDANQYADVFSLTAPAIGKSLLKEIFPG